MSRALEGPTPLAYASLRADAPKDPRAASVQEARAPGGPARATAPLARAQVLRPINRERRARFAR
jgi:hypothetical protein